MTPVKPILAALWIDARLLYRTYYVHSTIFIFAVLLVLVLQISRIEFANFADIVTAVILVDVVIAPVMLVGLLILYERGEGSLMALAVTPMRRWHYLAAKTVAIAVVCAIEMITLVLIAYDGQLSITPLLTGLLGIAAIATLLGVVAVARFDTLYRFILPMVGWTSFLSVPGFAVFFGWSSPVILFHPMSPPLALLEAAFAEITPARLALGYAGTSAWLAVSGVWAHGAYRRLQLRAAGG